MDGSEEVFFESVYKDGITFEWVKNKVAEHLEANYADLSLFFNDRRIPEPFCLVDMGVTSGSTIVVKLAEGAVIGHEALRAQVLAEIEQEGGNAEGVESGSEEEQKEEAG